MDKLTERNKIMSTISVMLAAMLQIIDTTIANVALPHIQGSLSATQDQIAWVLTAYIVSSAIMTSLIGWMSDKFGLKKIFLISVAGFTFSSALCGIASSVGELVVFRVLQGIFGASLVPLSQSTLLSINPPEKRGSAMAIWGMGVMVGPILGPTLGGYLTESYNWRWIFYVNIPIGLLAFLGILVFFHETETSSKKFDFIGFGLLSICIASIQLALDRGEQVDWLSSKEIITYVILIILSLWFFIWHTIYAIHSFIVISMFQDRNFSLGLIIIFFVGILLNASTMLIPPFLQNLLNYPVIDTGMLMVPRGLGTMIAITIVGKVISRIEIKYLIFLGLGLLIISLQIMTNFNLNTTSQLIISTGFIQGLGFGFVFIPLSTLTFSTLPTHQHTSAAGFYSLMRNIGGSIGISLANVILVRTSQINHAYLTEFITSFDGIIAQYYASNLNNDLITSPFQYIDQQINIQASLISYLNNFKFLMIMAIIMLPIILLIRSAKKIPKDMESVPNQPLLETPGE